VSFNAVLVVFSAASSRALGKDAKVFALTVAVCMPH
jgi:hypothetical protein